jgi:hypothetical protein
MATPVALGSTPAEIRFGRQSIAFVTVQIHD